MATAYKMYRKKDVFPEINVVGTLNIKQHKRRVCNSSYLWQQQQKLLTIFFTNNKKIYYSGNKTKENKSEIFCMRSGLKSVVFG